ncbi:MAG: DUF2400 family protein, partial [Bacteroidales bacterium]
IYTKYGSIDNMISQKGIANSNSPAWDLCCALRSETASANGDCNNPQCFPANFTKSALKRINLAVRWLVRNDGIVDLGVWHSITPDKLYIPLDLHVGNTARKLGILTRKSNDRRAVEELTSVLRTYNSKDPIIYDFALFGIGINKIDTE